MEETMVGLEGYRQSITFMLSFLRGVVILGWLCRGLCLGITLRDELLWFYGSDNIGQEHRCSFQLSVTFFFEENLWKHVIFRSVCCQSTYAWINYLTYPTDMSTA